MKINEVLEPRRKLSSSVGSTVIVKNLSKMPTSPPNISREGIVISYSELGGTIRVKHKVPRWDRDSVVLTWTLNDIETVKNPSDTGYPKGEFDLRNLTRNPDRRDARVPPVHSDRPPRGSVHKPQRNNV